MAYISKSCDLPRHGISKKENLVGDKSRSCDLFGGIISRKGNFDGLCKQVM
jgi:hypothetical protein